LREISPFLIFLVLVGFPFSIGGGDDRGDEGREKGLFSRKEPPSSQDILLQKISAYLRGEYGVARKLPSGEGEGKILDHFLQRKEEGCGRGKKCSPPPFSVLSLDPGTVEILTDLYRGLPCQKGMDPLLCPIRRKGR